MREIERFLFDIANIVGISSPCSAYWAEEKERERNKQAKVDG